MRNLFIAEIVRFRIWAAGYAVLHLMLLGLLTRMLDLAQQPRTIYQAFAAAYALTGLLLGLYQMGSYRRPNTWLNLLHRPIDCPRIAIALIGAGALMACAAIVLPLLAIAGLQHAMTPRVVDLRHLLSIASAGLIATCGYLAGCHLMLADRRYGFCALIFLVLIFFAQAIGIGATTLQLCATAWLAAMAVFAFKPDLSAPPRGPMATLMTAIPLQMSLWFALLLVGLGAEFAWVAQGSHPLNTALPPHGGAIEADRAEARDLLVAGLRQSGLRDAPVWRAQAAISELFTLGPPARRSSTRNALTNAAATQFDDPVRRERWTFSHDRMRFEGVRLLDGRPAGRLGVDGDAPFPSPPVPAGDGQLLGRETLYRYDGEARRILPRARLPAGDTLLGVALLGDSVALLGSRALWLYDRRDLDNGDGPMAARGRVPLPGRIGNLERVDVMELMDGALVSFAFTRGAADGDGRPYQQLLRVDERGRVTAVARRDLIPDYPVAWRYRDWYASPLLFAVQRAATAAFADDPIERDVERPPVPRAAIAIAAALMALSWLLAMWRLRRAALPMSARVAWAVACGAVGVPALWALSLMVPLREAPSPSPLAMPAIA